MTVEAILPLPPRKSKAAVHYTDKANDPNFNCANCIHFIANDGCELVIGLIDPSGWCDEQERGGPSLNTMAGKR